MAKRPPGWTTQLDKLIQDVRNKKIAHEALTPEQLAMLEEAAADPSTLVRRIGVMTEMNLPPSVRNAALANPSLDPESLLLRLRMIESVAAWSNPALPFLRLTDPDRPYLDRAIRMVKETTRIRIDAWSANIVRTHVFPLVDEWWASDQTKPVDRLLYINDTLVPSYAGARRFGGPQHREVIRLFLRLFRLVLVPDLPGREALDERVNRLQTMVDAHDDGPFDNPEALRQGLPPILYKPTEAYSTSSTLHVAPVRGFEFTVNLLFGSLANDYIVFFHNCVITSLQRAGSRDAHATVTSIVLQAYPTAPRPPALSEALNEVTRNP